MTTDTVDVNSGDSGNANYIENGGEIYNGIDKERTDNNEKDITNPQDK